MPKVSLAFFSVATIYLLIGMCWGIQMAIADNHLLAPAHAHLNLIGFVVQSVMGAFYALSGPKPSYRLAWTGFGLMNIGVVTLIPALAAFLDGSKDPTLLTLLKISPFVVIIGTLCFAVDILKAWKAKAA